MVTLIYKQTFVHSLIPQVLNKMYYVPGTVLGVGVTLEYTLVHLRMHTTHMTVT